MSDFYIVKNQNGLFASKQKEWVDGSEPKLLFRSPHKDEALNVVFEVSSKDIYVRAQVVSCQLDDKKHPIIEVIEGEDTADTSPAEAAIDTIEESEQPNDEPTADSPQSEMTL